MTLDQRAQLQTVGEVQRLLERAGWVHAPEADEDGGTGYARGEVRLELTFVVRRPDGVAAVRLRQGDVPFVRGILAGELRGLEGKTCHALAIEAVVAMKSGRRARPEVQAKDDADLVALRPARRRG